MDYQYEDGHVNFWARNFFRTFVCMSLTFLIGIHGYSYLWGPQDSEGDFGEVKYVVMQLTRGLSEVNRKHESLKNEMERLSSVMPIVAAAADRAKDAIDPKHQKNRFAIDFRDYDRQIADYALESAGAKIVDTGDTVEHIQYESPVSWGLYILSTLLCRECQGARAIINPGTLPGECWAFKGSRGQVTIKLHGSVFITGVSVEHIPAHISPTKEISSAPRLFKLEGLEYRLDPYPHEFGSYEYNEQGKPIQYFEVQYPSAKSYSFVRLRVLTNWGHPVYTCVYRIRIHGDLDTGRTRKNVVADDELQIENEKR